MASKTVTLSIDRIADRGEPIKKTCSRCKHPKPRDQFHKCHSRRDGLQNTCKDCTRFIGFVGYHEGNRGAYSKEYRERPEVRSRATERNKARWMASTEDDREKHRNYVKSPMGKLVAARSSAKARLRRDDLTEIRRSQVISRLASVEAEIGRLKARRVEGGDLEPKRSRRSAIAS